MEGRKEEGWVEEYKICTNIQNFAAALSSVVDCPSNGRSCFGHERGSGTYSCIPRSSPGEPGTKHITMELSCQKSPPRCTAMGHNFHMASFKTKQLNGFTVSF
jgi:hypothetical protein